TLSEGRKRLKGVALAIALFNQLTRRNAVDHSVESQLQLFADVGVEMYQFASHRQPVLNDVLKLRFHLFNIALVDHDSPYAFFALRARFLVGKQTWQISH